MNRVRLRATLLVRARGPRNLEARRQTIGRSAHIVLPLLILTVAVSCTGGSTATPSPLPIHGDGYHLLLPPGFRGASDARGIGTLLRRDFPQAPVASLV